MDNFVAEVDADTDIDVIPTTIEKEWINEIKSVAVAKNRGGIDGLTADDIVDFAKNPQTALHQCFQWDDTIAGHQYRIVQARALIRRIHVYVDPDAMKPVPIRVLHSIKVDDGENRIRIYAPMPKIMQDAALKKQLLHDAYRDMTSFKRKYSTLAELKEFIVSMDEFMTRLPTLR